MPVPPGDPGALERLAAELDGHAADMDALASSTASTTAATQHPAHLAAAQSALQDAQSAVNQASAAGDQAAKEIEEARKEMENPFGPERAVRQWIEKIHAPWDAVIGDAAVARGLARVAEGEKVVKVAKEFEAGLAGLLQKNARDMNEVLDITGADAKTQGDEILRLLTDTESIAHWNKGMQEAGELLTKGARRARAPVDR